MNKKKILRIFLYLLIVVMFYFLVNSVTLFKRLAFSIAIFNCILLVYLTFKENTKALKN